jgi:hypothetical protein
MTKVFLSYKSFDRARALKVADALEHHGFEVWVDKDDLRAGETWRQEIEDALDKSEFVLVLWPTDPDEKSGNWVRFEAARAFEQGKLFQATFGDKAKVPKSPFDFSSVEGFNLEHFGHLVRYYSEKIDPVILEIRDAIWAKRDGVQVPTPTAHRKIAERRALYSLIAASFCGVVIIALGILQLQNEICSSNSYISDTCGSIGIGRRPTREERLDYAAIFPNTPETCLKLRIFSATYREKSVSNLPSKANQRITEATVARSATWSPTADEAVINESRAPLFPSATTLTAQAAARSEVKRDARQTCETTGVANERRANKMKSIELHSYNCPPDPRGGYTCTARYSVTCGMEERAVVETCQ